jgi:signal transduction histidine kinase
MELRKTKVNLLDIIDTAIESSRANIASRRHKLRVLQPDEPIYLSVDDSRMTQVIVNLLNNACRYTPDDGNIAVILKKDGDCVTISVNDSGIGIPHDMQARVFDMFVQAGTRPAGGLGIGLTLVKCIVELHGGSIDVKSPGENLGSEFVVRLPM